MAGVARGSAINLLGGAVSASATFALTIVLTRNLAPEKVGTFFTATSIFLLLTALGQLGTSTGLVYFLGREEPARRPTIGAAYLRTAAVPVLTVAALTSGLLLLLGGQISTWFGPKGDQDFIHALWVLALFTPFAAALELHNAASRGLGTMRLTATLDQILRPTLQLALVLVAVMSDSVALAVAAWALPYLPTAIAARWWWGKRIDRSGPPVRVSAREFWRFTGPRAIASVAQLAMQRLDIVLVAALAGLREAAIYTAATRFLVVGQLVGTALSRAVQPRLARAIGTGDRASALQLYQAATAWLVLLAWPLYLAMALAASSILVLFGSEYTVGAPVIVILSLTMLVATGCGMVDTVLIMAGRTSWNLYNVLFALSVNVVADLLLIPRYGIVGAALGWSAAILCANLVPLTQVRFSIRVHPFGRATLVAMGVSALCFGGLPWVVTVFAGSGPLALFWAFLLATVVWTATVLACRGILDLASLSAGLRTKGTR